MPDGDVAPTNQQQVSQQAPQQPQPLGAQGRPGFFRSLLASLLTGVQAGVMAPQNAQGPSQAADIAQALPQQRIQQQQQAQQFQTQQDTEKARLALTQVQLQQAQLLLRSSSDDVANKFEDAGRSMVTKALENGTGKVLFEGDRDTAHNKQLELMKQNGNLSIMTLPSPSSKGQYAVVEFQPKGTIEEGYTVTLPGDKDLGVEEDTVDIPTGMSQSSANALLAQKARDHAAKINAAGRDKAVKDQQEGATQRTKLTIAGKEDVAKIAAQARDQKTTANNSGDVMYRQIVTRLHQDNARLATFLASNTVTGDFRKDPLVQLVNRDLQEKADYEAKNPQVLKGKGGDFSVPEGAPKPTKDNQVLKDAKGNIIAKSQGGAWVAP